MKEMRPRIEEMSEKEALTLKLQQVLETYKNGKSEKALELLTEARFILGPPGEICDACGGSGRKNS